MIDLLFAVLNTGLLCALGGYLFRRFIYDRIQQNMVFEQVTQLNLTKRQETLRKQEQGLVRAYYHQHYQYEELSKKVEAWRQALERKGQEQRVSLSIITSKVQEARSERDRFLQNRTIGNLITQKIVAGTRAELMAHFSRAHNKDRYLQYILDNAIQESTDAYL